MSAHFACQDVGGCGDGSPDDGKDCMGFSVLYDSAGCRSGPLSTYWKPNLWGSTRKLVSHDDGAMTIGTLRQMAGIILRCEDEMQEVVLGDDNPYFQLKYLCEAVLMQCANMDQNATYEDSEQHDMLEDFARRARTRRLNPALVIDQGLRRQYRVV